jgi:hypothetical protein
MRFKIFAVLPWYSLPFSLNMVAKIIRNEEADLGVQNIAARHLPDTNKSICHANVWQMRDYETCQTNVIHDLAGFVRHLSDIFIWFPNV